MSSMEYTLMVYQPNGICGFMKGFFFFELVIVMIKNLKNQYKRCNVKISIMHYLKWKRVVLFSFHYYCEQAIDQIQQKLWRAAAPQTPRFLQACQNMIFFRSNRPEVFCIKSVLRNFSKLAGNPCGRVSFLGLSPATLLKKRPLPATLFKKRFWHRCFPVSFAKFLRTPFLTEHLWWLLLNLAMLQEKIFLIKNKKNIFE